MNTIDLLIHSASQICTIPDHDGPQRGACLGDLGLIEDGAIAIHEGRIVAVGQTAPLKSEYMAREEVNANGRCLLPGFVDPHSHLPWAGERASEYEQRIAGATYMEIMGAGGGIMHTVRHTRQASPNQLVQENLPRLARMLAHGTTTLECKTGYGLDLATERKQLDVIQHLNRQQPIDLVPTFMGAHAVPTEYKGQTEAFVELVLSEMLPAIAQWSQENDTPLFCDVFCEVGVFDVAQTKRIFEVAQGLGFGLKIHADEFEPLGGTTLAVELGAISADHLVKTTPAQLKQLAQSNTIAVSLPGTPFGLGQTQFTPVQTLLAEGGAIALATDCNPGPSWCESMQMVITLACRSMRLTPAQALVASTLNSAYAIGRAEQVGSLAVGKQADILMLNVPEYRYLGYRFGSNLVNKVWKKGELVWQSE